VASQWGHARARKRNTITSPDRHPGRNGRHRRKRRFADRPWLALDRAPVRFFKALLLLHIALGWNGRSFQALETQFFEKDAHLGGTAFEAGQVLNALDRLRDRGRWMLTERGLQRVVVVFQLTGGLMKLHAFERLDAPRLV